MPAKTDTWMPLYIGDYSRDTAMLTCEEHGAYLLLIMAAWTAGGRLPNRPSALAAATRLALPDWERISPTILAFFDTDGAHIIHGRVICELERAEKLSDARRAVGKLGGRPRKQNESYAKPIGSGLQSENPSNQKQTRSQTETPSPSPSPSEPKGSSRRRAPGELADVVERLWGCQPVTDGRRKATRPDVKAALQAALQRGGDRDKIVAAFEAYYALPASRKEGGRYSQGAAVLLNNDRWKDYVPAAAPPLASPASPTQAWNGPPEVLAKAEVFGVAHWLARATWRDVPIKAVVVTSRLVRSKLDAAMSHWLFTNGIQLIVEEASAA